MTSLSPKQFSKGKKTTRSKSAHRAAVHVHERHREAEKSREATAAAVRHALRRH